MKLFKYILVGIILVGIILVQREFFPNKVLVVKTKTEFIKKDTTIYKGKLIPYEVEKPGRVDTIKLPADSAEIVRKYLALHREFYTKNYYKDTVTVDSMGHIYTSFRVTKNQADSLSIRYDLVQKKITTQTIVNVKNSLYIGSFIGKDNFTPTIMYSRKNKYNYFVGYNLSTGTVNGGVLINIDEIRKLW